MLMQHRQYRLIALFRRLDMRIHHNRNSYQSGFTLIELMISLALGLIVSLAAAQLFVTGVSSFNLQRGLGDVNENGRFGLEFLVKNIRSAEYARALSSTSAPTDSAVVIDAGALPSGTAALVSNNNSINLGLGASDQLVVRTWVPDDVNTQRDCEGNLVPAGNYMVSRYFLRADTPAGSASALACDGGFYGVGAASVANFGTDASSVVLMSFVDSFQVLYGVAAATTTLPQRYMTSAQYAALVAPRPPVVSVRVAVLVRSSESIGNLPTNATNIEILDEVVSASVQDAAGRSILRRLFVNTVAFRNVMI